jgi:hypothetical protein
VDVTPLSGGLPAPDSQLSAADLLVLQQRVLGLISF